MVRESECEEESDDPESGEAENNVFRLGVEYGESSETKMRLDDKC